MKPGIPTKTNPASTRGYDNSSRRQKQADTKERIAAATAELHAVKGADKTSYADIAEHAGVSLPTVYSHFPTENDLFQGCTSHVGNRAPALAVEKILSAPELSAAIGLLVSEMEKQHLYFEPWLSRRMDSYIPFLADMSDDIRQQQTELVKLVLRQFFRNRQTHKNSRWMRIHAFFRSLAPPGARTPPVALCGSGSSGQEFAGHNRATTRTRVKSKTAE